MKPIHAFRKFAVKQFALDWNYRWLKMNGPRAGAWIIPLFVINGLYAAFVETNWFWVGVLVVALYLGFVYFRIWPVKWEELDEMQKLQYGRVKFGEMTSEQISEYNTIYKKYNK